MGGGQPGGDGKNDKDKKVRSGVRHVAAVITLTTMLL